MNEMPRINGICDCCGNGTTIIFSARPLDYCLDKDFDIFQCSNCGHGMTKGVQESDLESVYEDGAYDPKENNFHRFLRPALNILESSKLEYLIKNKTNGNALLEIGTGKGNFLSAAIDAGYDAVGIEPSSRSYQIAKKNLGDKVFQCTLENIHLHSQLNRKYDYIFLWHVFEHLGTHESACVILKSFLKPSGLLIIAVPNFDSYQRKFGKRNWYHLDPPRHLSHFTPQSAKYLLERNAMVVNRVFYNSFFQNFLGEIITTNNMILSHSNILLNLLRFNKFYFQKTNLTSRVMNFLGFIAITSIIFIPTLCFTFINQLLGKSGTMVIVAEKDFSNSL